MLVRGYRIPRAALPLGDAEDELETRSLDQKRREPLTRWNPNQSQALSRGGRL